VAEELRERAHQHAVGLDPEAVLVLEDLDVEFLDNIVGLHEWFQARETAVQEVPGVAHQAVVGEFEQPPPGFGVARHGPI
jgi:hypothetical protein